MTIKLTSLAVLLSWAGSNGLFAASALPEPLPNWRIELVAEAPVVKHPSVVACAPDGRLFVAEDPMDISLPKADAAEGRILCFGPDRRVTVFAEKLHAVFGLQYLEGKLYVLHNPNFSVFDDDNGIGRNRRELIEQTLPEPSALNWNDHVPANFKLGMDGFFYVASGDKGLHGARGRDGSRADLFTGGIFRIRPDGTQLEVVCDGVRNVLDVALNAEDELFTYDNTDEHDWMGRFTHMVEGGFYGYPHDFAPRQPYTLWMMEDYGAGAACGAFANNEDGLPPEYEGNVFLADFGKRQIMRVGVERSGGTYRATFKEDLFPNPPGDFRPVGITPGDDGRSIYICDWQHRDEKADVEVGRLFKLVWIGPAQSQPRPNWYVPAACGKKFEATNEELIRGLSHRSRGVRIAAQRRLADRAAKEDLGTLLRNAAAPALARSHALWALDAIDGGRANRNDIIALSKESSPVLRRQAIRQLGARRAPEAIPALRRGIRDSDFSVRFQAVTALGRVGDAVAVPALLPVLEEEDLFTRYAGFTALNRIGKRTPSAWPEIVRGLASKSARIREATAFALRETYDVQLLNALLKLYGDTTQPLTARRSALDLISALHHQQPPWSGQWWAYHPALEPAPPKTEAWSGTSPVMATLREGLSASEAELRAACIEKLALVRDTNSAPALRDYFKRETDPRVKTTILRALGAMRDPDATALVNVELRQSSTPETMTAALEAAEQIGGSNLILALTDLVTSTNGSASVLAQATRALGNLNAKSALRPIQSLARHADADVRASAFVALGQLEGEAALPGFDTGLKDRSLKVRQAIVQALGNLRSTNAVPTLLTAYADEELRPAAFSTLVRTPDARALEPLLTGLGSRNPAVRNAAHLAILGISDQVLKQIETQAPTLPNQALIELRHIYAGNKTAEAGPLFAKRVEQHSLAEYSIAGTQRPGDPERGRNLFSDRTGLNCIGCHRVSGSGSDIGPDLSGIGLQFDRTALCEAVLYPSKTVREGYQQVLIETNGGEEISGIVKSETSDFLLLRDSAGTEHKISRPTIKTRRNSLLSLMPNGLQAALTLEEFSDLIGYLASLKGKP